MKKLLLVTLLLGASAPLIGMDSATDWGRSLDSAFAEYERISRAIDDRDMAHDAQNALRILNDFDQALNDFQVRLNLVKAAVQTFDGLLSWQKTYHARFFKLAQDLRVCDLTDRDEREKTLEIADGLLLKIETQVARFKIDIANLRDVLDAWNLDLAYESIATLRHQKLTQRSAPVASPSRVLTTRHGWFYTFNKKMAAVFSFAMGTAGRVLMFAMAHGESLVGGEMGAQPVVDAPAKRTIDASDYLESMGAAL